MKNPPQTFDYDISIPLHFNGPQPNAYGVTAATAEPVRAGSLIGDTRIGGSVNFELYRLVPHCNGTHTECIGHITRERIAVRDCLRDAFVPAILLSVGTVAAEATDETAAENSRADDNLITADVILRAGFDPNSGSVAIIIRTLPNDDSKLIRRYGEDPLPPYFSMEAIELFVSAGIRHLLVDLPSIDRLFDDGKLSNHRRFWRVPPGSFDAVAGSRFDATITELIYASPAVPDGCYYLNLQIPPFAADAAPSRPLLFRID